MRYGVLADIHGNLHALESALLTLEREGVDALICAGDLVGYGPLPDECVELVVARGVTCVAGNHDLIAIGRLSDDRCPRRARESLRWTREVLTDATVEYLMTLPLRTIVAGRVVVAHGSLDDPEEYVTRPNQAADQLRLLSERYADARALVLGHAHRPRIFDAAGRVTTISTDKAISLVTKDSFVFTPGSVGQSSERDARARFAVLDVERQLVTFHAVPYDVDACVAELRRKGLPPDACFRAAPSPVGRALRWARRTAVRVGR
jgi:predicted phosphodiesterase